MRLFLFAGDFAAHLCQAQALLVHKVGGDADIQGGEKDADQRYQRWGIDVQLDLEQRRTEHRAAQSNQRCQGEVTYATDDQRAEQQNQQRHQAGNHRETKQGQRAAGMHRVNK